MRIIVAVHGHGCISVCSSCAILFFSYAALAPNFEFEWDCERVRRMVYFCQHPSHLADPSSRYRKKQQLLFRLQPVQPESDQPGLLAHPNRPNIFRGGWLRTQQITFVGAGNSITRPYKCICRSGQHLDPSLKIIFKFVLKICLIQKIANYVKKR